MLLRQGLPVRGCEFRLFYPKPRSSASTANDGYPKNRITFRPHCRFGPANEEVDFLFFLNGLPIVALELKHEKNQTVYDAVAQFATRDHAHGVLQYPFLYLAADTSDVMAATDPRREANFRWHNTGLTNQPATAGEYPVEFLYREVLSKENLLEALAFFLVYHPAGSLEPSTHDAEITRQLAEAGAIVGIQLLDHIIFNAQGYFSFLEAGRLPGSGI